MATPTPLQPAPSALTSRAGVYLKREDVHELGAFKWRGALPVMEAFRRNGTAEVVTASTGNHGAAAAWAAEQVGVTTTVYAPIGSSRTKLARIEQLGATVIEVGADVDEAKDLARAYAESRGLPFFEDGAEPAQLDGYAAIATELLDQLATEPAAVVVPVGNGALLAGVGRVVGARAAGTRRIGVVSADAPVMARSWTAGHPVECDVCDTIADGLAVRVAIPTAVEWLLSAADDMLEVAEPEIAHAVAAFDAAGIRAEAAAAAALAALPYLEDEGPIVLVVTGGNIDDDLLARCRSWSAAEGPKRT